MSDFIAAWVDECETGYRHLYFVARHYHPYYGPKLTEEGIISALFQEFPELTDIRRVEITRQRDELPAAIPKTPMLPMKLEAHWF